MTSNVPNPFDRNPLEAMDTSSSDATVFPGYAILEEHTIPAAGGDNSSMTGFDSMGRRRARRRSICIYRGRRKSIVEHTVFFPTISAWAMEQVLCYCEFRARHQRDPDFSELPFDFSRSLELLMAANYLEIENLVSYLSKIVADNFPADDAMEELPAHLIDEIMFYAPLENLVKTRLMDEDRWKKVVLRRWGVTKSATASVSFSPSPPGGYVGSPLPGSPSSPYPVSPSPNTLLQRTLQYADFECPPNFWRETYLQKVVQDEMVALAPNAPPATVQKIFALMDLCQGDIRDLILRNSSVPVAVSLSALVLTGHFPLLEQLDVSKVGIGPDGCRTIAMAIRCHPRLTRLNLGNNKIRQEGIEAIAQMLRENTTLTVLQLGHNGLGPNGAAVLASSLQDNQALIKLALGYNQIRAQGAQAIAEALRSNIHLTALDIANNYIGDEGGLAIARAMQANQTLSLIRLWDASMTTEGGRAIVAALQDNIGLTDVSMGRSSLDQESRQLLAELLHRNSYIEAEEMDKEPQNELDRRREYERDLLYGSDTVFSDDWLLIDEQWLAQWREFVAKGSRKAPPGPISNWRLVNEDGTPKPGMEKLYDYRGVSPQVWKLFSDIYGGGPPIRRRRIDLYAAEREEPPPGAAG